MRGQASVGAGAPAERGRAWLGATAILLYLALFKLLLHLLTADNYGYFRDELYYMAAELWPQVKHYD